VGYAGATASVNCGRADLSVARVCPTETKDFLTLAVCQALSPAVADGGYGAYTTAEVRATSTVDIRLSGAGDLDDNPSAPTLFGLVVSPRTRSPYLGYERSDANRPMALAAWLRWRHRGTFLAL
jgi:hypothetical protein